MFSHRASLEPVKIGACADPAKVSHAVVTSSLTISPEPGSGQPIAGKLIFRTISVSLQSIGAVRK